MSDFESEIFAIENRFFENRTSGGLWVAKTMVFGFSMVEYLWSTRFQLKNDLSVDGPSS